MKTDTPPTSARDIFRYDPETGHFHWLIVTRGRGGFIKPGDIAGTDKDGYVNLKIAGVIYRAHRVAWYLMTGDWLPASQDIDHINRNRSDNRWPNLRLATRSENCHNKTRDYGGRSGVTGVHFASRSQKWEARIYADCKLHMLGQFERFADAVSARRAAELKFLGRNEVPDDQVPNAPLIEPVKTPRTGMTLEGKARHAAAVRKPRNADSRYPGVGLNAKRDKWIASIRNGQRKIFLGTFLTYEEAVQARKAAEAQYHS